MKKLIVVFVAVALTVGAYAQTGTTTKKVSPPDKNTYQNQNTQKNSVDKSMNQQDMNHNQKQNLKNNSDNKSNSDGIVMQNGKLMQVKNGQTTLVDRELTLTNGTKISTDGTCIKKDGSKMMLKEGQHMDMSGKMLPAKTNKDNNMYLVPDSTRKNKN